MGRDLSCPSGKPAYKTKRDAEKANPDQPVHRCHRCRYWHLNTRGTRRSRRMR